MGLFIPFAFKNARFEWVDFRGGLGVKVKEELSLSSLCKVVRREKMRAENGYS